MASNLRGKYNEWIFIFVLLPATLAMLVSIFFFWRLLREDHRRLIEDRVTGVSAALEQSLRSESLRMRTLAKLPATDSLVSIADRRYTSIQRSQDEKTESDWANASRDDLVVRSVLDNDLGLMLSQLVRQDPQLISALICDRHGAIMAASEKPSRYYQDGEEWWSLLRAMSGERTGTEGVSDEGVLGLVHASREPNGVARAVVRQEIRFGHLAVSAAAGQEATNSPDVAVFVVSQQGWPVTGHEHVFSNAAPVVVKELNQSGRLVGWVDGFTYRARALDAGLHWARPVWVVGVQQEGAVPAAVYGPLAVAFLIGCAAVFGVFSLAREIGRRLFFDPMVEAAEAGLWLLRQVHGQESKTDVYMRQHPWVNIVMDEDGPMQRELGQWLKGVQEAAQSDVAELTVAMKHDLDLATEFQQAFMSRPYPDVPATYVEGRLRLEFFHSYKPALALGGDFFDIEAVGPDCAGIFIGDVMGHGTRSALLTSIIRTLLNELYPQGRNPAHFLRELNRMLCDLLRVLPTQFFASAGYFAADTTSRIATYSLAGHPPPFHLHRSVGRVIRLEKPKPRGAALGVIEDEQFGAETVRLVDGDIFVFYTDGAYEAVNAEGEQFGMARLEKSLRTHIYESPGDILPLVLQDVVKFMGNQPVEDDICLVAVHVTSQPPKRA